VVTLETTYRMLLPCGLYKYLHDRVVKRDKVGEQIQVSSGEYEGE